MIEEIVIITGLIELISIFIFGDNIDHNIKAVSVFLLILGIILSVVMLYFRKRLIIKSYKIEKEMVQIV